MADSSRPTSYVAVHLFWSLCYSIDHLPKRSCGDGYSASSQHNRVTASSTDLSRPHTLHGSSCKSTNRQAYEQFRPSGYSNKPPIPRHDPKDDPATAQLRLGSHQRYIVDPETIPNRQVRVNRQRPSDAAKRNHRRAHSWIQGVMAF